MNKSVNNAFYYTIGSLVRAFASFLLLPIFANILGSAQYGVLNLLQTFSSILAILMTFGIERSLYRLYYDFTTENSRNRFFSTVFWSINIVSIVIIVLAFIFAGWLSDVLGGVDAIKVVVPVIIYAFLAALIQYSQIIMQVEQNGKSFLLISMLLLITYNVISLLFLFLYEKTYAAMVYGNLVANAIVLPFAYYRIRKKLKFEFDFSILSSTIRFSFPLLLMAIFAWALNMSDRLFLANFSTLKDLGLYSMGSKIVSVMILLDGAIFQAYGPYFFNLANNEAEYIAKDKIKETNNAITLIICSMAICIMLLSNVLFHTILKPEYQGSLIYVYILILGAVLTGQTGLLNPMIYQNRETKGISIITIVCACISVGLNRLLIPSYGPIMAAITNLFSSFCMFTLTLLLAKKNYYVGLNMRIIMIALMIIGIYYCLDIFISSILVAFLLKCLFVACAVLLIVKIGIINILEIRKVVSKLASPVLNKLK